MLGLGQNIIKPILLKPWPKPGPHNTNFTHGDHSDISGAAGNAASDLEELVGRTYYFHPPLVGAALILSLNLQWNLPTRT